MKNSLLVFLGLIIGCGVGAVGFEQVSAQSVAPNLEAPRWQHICHQFERAIDLTPMANRAGADGWELVAVHSVPRVMGDLHRYAHVACFKRTAPTQQPRQQSQTPTGVDDPFNISE
jgi:hypothetical protein